MADKFRGKNAIVTGAGRGIGRAVALALAAEGARVVINDLGVAINGADASSALADEVVREITDAGGVAVASYDSVADFAAAENIIKTCVDKFGPPDILVNVAGILRDRMIFNMTEDEWDAVIAVHLKGTFNCTRHACVLMRQRRSGRIINFTSTGWLGNVGQANYSAAKGGIVSFTRAVARDLGRYGITCNAVAPVAGTRMTKDPQVEAGLRKRLAAGLIEKEAFEEYLSMPGPETVAPLVLYLASDEAANINGQVLGVISQRVCIYSEGIEAKSIYKREGLWTLGELIDMIPKTLAQGLVNPAPPAQSSTSGSRG